MWLIDNEICVERAEVMLTLCIIIIIIIINDNNNNSNNSLLLLLLLIIITLLENIKRILKIIWKKVLKTFRNTLGFFATFFVPRHRLLLLISNKTALLAAYGVHYWNSVSVTLHYWCEFCRSFLQLLKRSDNMCAILRTAIHAVTIWREDFSNFLLETIRYNLDSEPFSNGTLPQFITRYPQKLYTRGKLRVSSLGLAGSVK